MATQSERCALCGSPVGDAPVVRTVDGVQKHFCCQGCARAYETAHQQGVLNQITQPAKTEQPAMTDFILDRGERAYFSVDGMWCAGCAVAAEQLLRNQPGVKSVDVSFAAERGRIQYDPDQVDLPAVLQKLDGLGYRARLRTDRAEQEAERKQEHTLLQLITAAAFGMQVMVLYIELLYPAYAAGRANSSEVQRLHYLIWLLVTPVLFYGGISFLRGAWRSLRARTATMDTLVALGTLSAYGYSVYVTLTAGGEAYFDAVVMITTFIMVGRYLEALGGARARKDIRKLLQLQPEQAWRRTNDQWKAVDSIKLAVGDIILIKPGERVPVDATVREGAAAVDESLLTGEPMPVEKVSGDTLYAGSVVTDDALTAEVAKPVGDTRLSQIAHVVEETLSTKPPIQRLADRVSVVFALGILVTAIVTFGGWWVTGHSPAASLLAAVAVLVVACPCALGLATPLALTVTLGRTTQMGILVRNPASLETAATLDRIVFDKTGTLTQGKLTVRATRIEPELHLTEADLLYLAAGVEQFSEHPLARAIVSASGRGVPQATAFENKRGLGATARVRNGVDRQVKVGSQRYLGVDEGSGLYSMASAQAEQGNTLVWIGWDDRVAGYLVLRDDLNPTAMEAVGQLHELAIRTVIISGDSPLTTRARAAELGTDEQIGGASPTDKADHIRSWQADGERVGMVGDGVNDAPGLAQADVSCTVASGTDVAGETSDVILTRSDLTLIPAFVRISRRTRRIIGENLGWAFAYNLVAVPLAAFGLISPVIAALAMACSSLLVVGNSLRLRS